MDCIWGLGSSVLGRYDGEGIGCWLSVLDDGSGRGRFSNNNIKTRHLGIMRREIWRRVSCVCVSFLWLVLLLSGFLLARFVSRALLGWRDGWMGNAAQHHLHVLRALAAQGMKTCISN